MPPCELIPTRQLSAFAGVLVAMVNNTAHTDPKIVSPARPCFVIGDDLLNTRTQSLELPKECREAPEPSMNMPFSLRMAGEWRKAFKNRRFF